MRPAYNGRMVIWNLLLKLGLIGLSVGVVCTALCVVLMLCKQNVRASWAVAVCVLFSVSVLACLGSQVTVVSKLSSEDADGPGH